MNQTESKQLAALGFCAYTVPAILLLPQTGWLWALIASVTVAVLLLQKNIQLDCQSTFCKGILVAVFVWNLLLLGKFSRLLAFPENKELIGLLLLLLSAYAAGKKVVPRVAAVVFFFLAAMYAALLGFALPNIQPERITPTCSTDWTLLPFALAPTLLLYIRKDGAATSQWKWLLGGIILAVLAAVVTAGMNAADFYTAAKSVNILGTMERLEPLVSAALTAGGFCLLGLICEVNQKILCTIFEAQEGQLTPVNFLGGVGGFYLAPQLPSSLIALGTAIFWGAAPFLIQLVVSSKKFEKFEKNA